MISVFFAITLSIARTESRNPLTAISNSICRHRRAAAALPDRLILFHPVPLLFVLLFSVDKTSVESVQIIA